MWSTYQTRPWPGGVRALGPHDSFPSAVHHGAAYRRVGALAIPTWPEIRIGVWRARFYQPSGRPVVMANSTRLLIKNGTLIDGSGGDPVPNKLLVVEGNRITLVGETDGSMRPETPDDTVIDATGKFILPGLIDAHCHISLHQGALPSVNYTSTAEFCTLWAAHAIGRVLRAGGTSIAVPGGKWFTDVTLREPVEGGLLQRPRIVLSRRA